MKAVYTFGILVYSFIIRCISPFNPKAKLWYTGRKDLNMKDLESYKGAILIQCSSLGEFEQGKPLLNALKEKYPDKPIVLSFFSPSGYESKKNTDLVDKVIYLPVDTPEKTKQFVNALEPEMAFFIKYDFWPNLFSALKASQCKIYLVSTIFRPDQAFFKWYGAWYRKTLKHIDHFFVQNTISQQLLDSLGLKNTSITGDTRFDQVLNIKDESFNDTIIDAFVNTSEQIVIAGSTWLQDEQLILKCIKEFPDWKWIIAPHETNTYHIKELTQLFNNVDYALYTKTNASACINSQVLVIDTIGILKYLYRYGQVSYIGGGFGKGIHNTLEPAVYGIPVLFGPKHQKFQEAQDLLAEHIGYEINEENIVDTFKTVINTEKRENIRKQTTSYIEKQKGAITKIMNYLM